MPKITPEQAEARGLDVVNLPTTDSMGIKCILPHVGGMDIFFNIETGEPFINIPECIQERFTKEDKELLNDCLCGLVLVLGSKIFTMR